MNALLKLIELTEAGIINLFICVDEILIDVAWLGIVSISSLKQLEILGTTFNVLGRTSVSRLVQLLIVPLISSTVDSSSNIILLILVFSERTLPIVDTFLWNLTSVT